MRTALRIQRHLRHIHIHTPQTRTFTSATPNFYSSAFSSGPSPPRLPKEEQELFEKLQRQSTGAFSTPNTSASSSSSTSEPSPSPSRFQINQSPDSSSTTTNSTPTTSTSEGGVGVGSEGGTVGEKVGGDDLHPHMRRGAPPEFEGDVNPKTGEVGGPKNEPLRWGTGGDWSFNGRVTDF